MSNRDMVNLCHIALEIMERLESCEDEYFCDELINAIYYNDCDKINDLLINYIPMD